MSMINMPANLMEKSGGTPEKYLENLLGDFQQLSTECGDFTTLKHRVKKFRDLSVVELVGDLLLVIACDSNAGCGEKPKDHFKWPYEEAVLGMFKVTMMEILASGATPVCVINNLCMEMEPTGKEIIKYMREQMVACGMDPDTQLTGSTEDNAKTVQTGVGLTIIALAAKSQLRLGATKKGDIVVCIGNPQGGGDSPYREVDLDIAKVGTMQDLCTQKYIHEILPCGSHGLRHEANELASYAGGTFRLFDEAKNIRLEGSCGASTAVIVSVSPGDVEKLIASVKSPVPAIPIGVIE